MQGQIIRTWSAIGIENKSIGVLRDPFQVTAVIVLEFFHSRRITTRTSTARPVLSEQLTQSQLYREPLGGGEHAGDAAAVLVAEPRSEMTGEQRHRLVEVHDPVGGMLASTYLGSIHSDDPQNCRSPPTGCNHVRTATCGGDAPMAAPAPEVFDHSGPWTEEDFLALPVDRRLELLDGALLVSPSARVRHQRLSSWLWAALDAAVPAWLEVLEAINVRVGPGKILIPDLAVVSAPGLDLTVCEAADVVLIVEITSPGNVVANRAVKPQLYAQAGIPHYLRVELRPADPCAVVCRLEHDRYVEVARVEPGCPLVLTEPIAITLNLATLAATTRPADGGSGADGRHPPSALELTGS
jgi:Uma2 family endonuclease